MRIKMPSMLGVACTLLFLSGTGARAEFLDHCCWTKCPPKFVHCAEGPPRIKFKQGCPKPVCDPCRLQGWGYYQNCWHPWPWPPNFSRCYDFPPHPMMGFDDMQHPDASLPMPRRTENPAPTR